MSEDQTVPNLSLFFASLSKANISHSKQSALFLALYLGVGLAIFGACSFLGITYQDVIYQALLDYIFPSSWHSAAELIVDFFFESQSKIVLAGLISSGSLVMASLLLFPLKENCSAAYEKAMGLPNGPGKELPLWIQGIEEGKLLLLYVTSQMVILAIGYYPFIYTQIIAEILSVVFLAFTFGIDFIAPTLQRHGIKYNAVIRLLLKRFLSTILWGAFYALPILYLGKYLLSQEELTLIEVSSAIFGINLLFLSFAIASGTYIASALVPKAKLIPPISVPLKKSAYLIIGILFTAGLIFHGRIFMSIHHKSQVFKMNYDISWKDVDIKMDSIFTLFKEQGEIAINFPLQVSNPTAYDFELEDSFIIIKQADREIAHMAVSRLIVPAGKQVIQHMHTDIRITGKSLSGFRELMSGWSAYLEYDVLPGIPLIIKII